MVPGDIYIGKEFLVQYEISHGDPEYGIDPYFEHRECGKEVELDTELYGTTTPWDYLNAILQHEKECPKKCRDVLPADDSSTMSAKLQVSQDAVAAVKELGKLEYKSPSRANGNVYASEAEMRNIPTETVVPNPNVL